MKRKSFLSIITLVFALFLLIINPLPAQTHFRGGEITWERTPQANFRLIMKLYRDCAGSGTFGDTLWMKSNVPGFDSIGMVRTAIHDITPECDCPAGAALDCATATQTGSGALEEHIYTSTAFYPNGVPFTGVPPVTGYYLAFEGCCRAPTDNLAPGNSNFAIRSVMYPFQNNPINNCFDNSPAFYERSPIVTCAGSSNWYIHKHLDSELDSISWTFAPPLHDINTPVTAYHTGYNFNSPLPGLVHDSANIPVTINPQNGELSFTSHTTGSFSVVVKATAYKCGHKVAEIFREMPVIIILCSPNNPPVISVDGQPATFYIDTVYAGALLTYTIAATDTDTCQGSTPSSLQTVKLSTFGKQYAAPMMPPWPGYTFSPCINPLCASLSPVIHYDSMLTGSPSVQTTFTWQTGCQHIASPDGCGTKTNKYDFFFTAIDNFCPVPAKRTILFRVVVISKPPLLSTPIVCADVQSNGDVLVSWHQPEDSLQVFDSYHLYSANHPSGFFTVVDSIFALTQTSYLHQGAGAHLQPIHYLQSVRSYHGFAIYGEPIDTISTLFVEVASYDTIAGIAHLAWNPLRANPLPGTVPEYTIHREYPAGTWNIAGTTTGLSWSDTLGTGNKLVKYRISTSDTVVTSTGPVVCQSNSNVAELLVSIGITARPAPGFILGQNIPNPAGSSTTIPFYLPEPGEATLVVYDINGRMVAQQHRSGQAGENTIMLDLSGYAAGIYSYSLHFRGAVLRKTMVVE